MWLVFRGLAVFASFVPVDGAGESCALNLVQKSAEVLRHGKHSIASEHDAVMLNGASEVDGLQATPFYLYDVDTYEPRFHGGLSTCARKGADYFFLESLLEHSARVTNPATAEVFVVPCLFESFRRCTTTNHAEQPPPTALIQTGGAEAWNSHPEDFEDVPWVKPFDTDTATCLQMVMASDVFRMMNGYRHFWVVADWTMNFGRTAEQTMFKNMTIGRIEVVDDMESKVQGRAVAIHQSRCSVVVPYASDVAYVQDFSNELSFEEWMARPTSVSFRFEDRRYVLFCKSVPCANAIDATPMRKQSLSFASKFGGKSSIEMQRVTMNQYREELNSAKFCLVIRGDTPSTHAFFDALAANCIPIIISDRWPIVAKPFARGPLGKIRGDFDYPSFTLKFSAHRWMNNLDSVVAEFEDILSNQDRLFSLFQAMQRWRRHVLWSMPSNNVGSHLLVAAKTCMNGQ